MALAKSSVSRTRKTGKKTSVVSGYRAPISAQSRAGSAIAKPTPTRTVQSAYTTNQGGQAAAAVKQKVKKDKTKPAAGTAGGTINPLGQYAALAQSLFPPLDMNSMSDQQMMEFAQTQVGATIDPVLQQITDMYNQRAASGSAAINNLTGQYVQDVSGYLPEVTQQWDTAVNQSAAANAALSDYIRNEGATMSQDISDRMKNAESTPDAIQTHGRAPEQGGAGMSVEQASQGTLATDATIQMGAAEKQYAAALPAYARGYGLMQLGAFQGGLNQQMQQDTGELRAQVPGLVQGLYGSLLNRELQKKQLVLQNRSYRADVVNQMATRDSQMSMFAQSQGMDMQKFREEQRQFGLNYGLQQDQLGLDKERLRLENAKFRADQATQTNPKYADAFQSGVALAESLLNPTDQLGQSSGPGLYYAEARKRVKKYLAGLLRDQGASDSLLNDLADSALTSVGYDPGYNQQQVMQQGFGGLGLPGFISGG